MKQNHSSWKEALILTGGELLFALVALPLYLLLVLPKYTDGQLPGFVPVIATTTHLVLAIVATCAVMAASVGLVFLLVTLFGIDTFSIEELEQLIERFSIAQMALMYAAAGFAEEFLFRVVLLDLTGLVVSALLFTVAHAAYWRKPLLLLHVFILGLLLGGLYMYTQSLLLCALAHGVYNLIVSWMLKQEMLN